MNNLTPELIAKAKAAKSAEELLELAKVNEVNNRRLYLRWILIRCCPEQEGVLYGY